MGKVKYAVIVVPDGVPNFISVLQKLFRKNLI